MSVKFLNIKSDNRSSSAAGTLYTLVAFAMWGVLPGYWKQLQSVPALEIIFHRIVWSFLVSALLVILVGKKGIFLDIIRNRKQRYTVYFTSLAIAVNWLIYVYAINAGMIIETSLGYYINPLMSVFFGMVILKERLTLLQMVALFLASCGVLYITWDFGVFPWLAILLAASFALYGLFKKMAGLDSVASLTAETMFLSLFALPILLYRGFSGTGAMGSGSLHVDLFLSGAGIVSAVPLYLFASGAKAIPLSRVGFIQYVSPTLSLIIGIVIYGEKFTRTHCVSFGLIWTALALYTVSGFIERRSDAVSTKG